jgi:hypothetical protein
VLPPVSNEPDYSGCGAYVARSRNYVTERVRTGICRFPALSSSV